MSSIQRRIKPHAFLRLLTAVLIALALLAFIGYFAVYNLYALALFRFPFDYDQGEGFELMDTILFSQGEWPYRDISVYPFYASNYPPFFHLMVVPLVWLFGPHYWTGRLVSYVATLVTAAAIGYAVQREGKRWWLSALAGLAYLASNYVYHVGPLFRQHVTMVMFETLAVVLVTLVIEREERQQADLAGWGNLPGRLGVMVLLLLAGYTKQLAYATVAAVFAFLFLRRPLRAIAWAVPFVLVTAAIFLAINLATDGQWFINTVSANVNPFVPGQAAGLYRQWFGLHPVLVTAAVTMVLYHLYAERLSAYAIWFAFAAVNSATAGKWGAGESYFVTAIAAACILTGLGFARLLQWSEHRGGVRPVVVASLIGVLFLFQADRMFHMPTHTPWLRSIALALGRPAEIMVAPQTSCSAPRPAEPVTYVDAAGATLLGRPPTAADALAGQRMAALVKDGKTAAFSEEAGFNLYAGRDVVTNPTQLLNLYHNDQVDLTEMHGMLNRQEFDTIILRAQFYPPPILEVIGQRYHTTHLVEMNGFIYCVMKPRQ